VLFLDWIKFRDRTAAVCNSLIAESSLVKFDFDLSDLTGGGASKSSNDPADPADSQLRVRDVQSLRQPPITFCRMRNACFWSISRRRWAQALTFDF
jgi:hypothetical protein